ncbi:MAG: hypothetical protein U5K72_20370 [Balneolaceae bacterium]|nr:hypothetical protein [Balneolaceae bacterium]
MNPIVKAVENKTDAELIIKDKTKAKSESVSPHSRKKLTNENLFDLTFISETKSPIYIRIKSIPRDSDLGDGNDPVIVEAGDPEEVEDL